jgi:hypothetical protein
LHAPSGSDGFFIAGSLVRLAVVFCVRRDKSRRKRIEIGKFGDDAAKYPDQA